MTKKKSEKNYHHGDLRAAILEVAETILASEGPATLSLRDIARRLNVSHAAPYRHFADRESILAGLAQEGFELLAKQQETVLANPKFTAREKLKRCGSAYLKVATAKPNRFQVMFGTAIEKKSKYPDLRRASARAFAALVSAIRLCQEEGVIDPKRHTGQLAVAAWSTVHGLSMLVNSNREVLERAAECSVAHLEESILERLIRGMA